MTGLSRSIPALVCLIVSAAAAATVWVALPESAAVASLDAETGECIVHHDFAAAPTHLSLSPDGRYLYVACHGDGQTHVIDPQSGALYKRLPYVVPVFAAADADHYIAPGLGGVHRYMVDGFGSEQLAYLPDTRHSYDYALTPDGRWFTYVQRYVSRPGREAAEPPSFARVAVCDLQQQTGAYLELEAQACCTAVSAAGGCGAAAALDGSVTLFELSAEPVAATILHFDESAFELAFDAPGEHLLCFCPSGVHLVALGDVTATTTLEPAAEDWEGRLVAGDLEAEAGLLVVADKAGTLWRTTIDQGALSRLAELDENPVEIMLTTD